MDVQKELEKVIELTRSQNKWRRTETINMIASENVMSPLAEALYMSDFMSRYAEGKPFKRFYQGTKYVDEVETLAMDLMNQVTGSKFCDLRPTSGTLANAAVFRVLASPGEKALIAPVQAGAHVSHTKFGTLGALGIEHIEMPYDEENMNVDVDKAVKMIEQIKPRFVVLGGSLYLFPHPTKELAPHVHAVGAKLVYDAAHVYGLMTGKVWANPLDEGADFLNVSTHKTFPGPQGGAIFSNEEEEFKKVSRTIFPWFVSNHHLHRLPSTAVTALEMKVYGEDYAKQITRNSKALAEALASMGFKVVGEHLGYTKSHQVAVDVKNLGGGAYVARTLESANIIVNKNLLPHDPPEAVNDPSGIRIGVQEMTRFGMKEGEMEEIAGLMKEILVDKKDINEMKRKVIQMRSRFLEVKYALNYDLSKYNSKLIPMIL
ncbi:Serine hydroxymethyltransferase [Metallosphaera sp. J1]|uniref:serine hydroxymethyltransferase n=1 Tax=Metallosphaera TaxID=41980 RepID=UPI001EDDF765|nr:serine hydroxymethyltransferase [Metallosphaera javensis (ex Hofmann et al. 2022)]MCG3109510.1 Serine hydroxymethyltransferase [Metallosphaera javensis (ex Hofmann et al. 2022)]BCS94157.1 MAG: serine hydroxymethyltransferase [Metallosphaera javensis (ex Sakai et al. 2022)]